ncbi:MAG TPA: ABC transporter permease, partial [Terriglobales bacterium]|nr:ABC transporter permease [Terriglobales bacterium]
MKRLRAILARIVGLFDRDRRDCELRDELESHLQMDVDDHVRSGLSPDEARRRALLELGGVDQVMEAYREQRGVPSLETLAQDVRYAMRMLRKNPVFAIVAILTLGLGIGANTAIFTLINAIMLRSLPVKNPEQLVFFSRSNIEGKDWPSFPYPFYREVRDRNTVLDGVICQSGMAPSLSVNGSSERVNGELVSGNFYDVLGIRPYIGRLFTTDDDRLPGAHPVVVLSYGFWKRRFGSDPAVVGRNIRLNTTDMTIIGVSAPGFESLNLGSSPDIRAPMMMLSAMVPGSTPLESRGDWWLRIAGRLKPGVSMEEARAAIHPMLIAYMEENNAGHSRTEYDKRRFASERLLLLPAGKGARGLANSLSTSLFVLMGVVGVVLLIACVNIANLLLARTAERQREIAVRLALGAARSRLIRQLLTESFLLAIIGGVLGVAAAYWGAKILVTLLAGNQVTPSLNIAPDYRVLGFTLLISLCATLLFGLAPSWQAVGRDVLPNLKGDASSLTGLRLSGRKLLVSAQVSLSLILLIGAGLFLRSLHNLRSLDTGFDRENVLQLRMDPTLVGYKAEQLDSFYRDVAARVSTLPGVRSASFANIGLLAGTIWGSGIKIEGRKSREG